MKKLNIAELIKDCPKGMELYSPIFGKVYLNKIRPQLAIVVTVDKKQGDLEEFLYDGRYGMNGECMIFPSKDQRDWSKFQRPFKNGDIVYNRIQKRICIHHYREDGTPCVSYCRYNEYFKTFEILDDDICIAKQDYRFATKEEEQKLFDAIKANGYKWNSETKTLEKLIEPKFKVGDRIKKEEKIATILRIYENYYDVKYDSGIGSFTSDLQDEWELIPSKFDINTLKPFDKVLVRDCNNERWSTAIYSHKQDDHFVASGHFKQCIPYEGNEHLLGTFNDCDDFYKIW